MQISVNIIRNIVKRYTNSVSINTQLLLVIEYLSNMLGGTEAPQISLKIC